MMPCSELRDSLPHRPPMVWVDFVVSSSESGGECLVVVKDDALYISDGALRPSAYIEFLAQSFGYLLAHHAKTRGSAAAPAPKKAFLVSVTNCEFADSSSRAVPEELRILISNVKAVGPITLFDGVILNQDAQQVCRASLKVYSE